MGRSGEEEGPPMRGDEDPRLCKLPGEVALDGWRNESSVIPFPEPCPRDSLLRLEFLLNPPLEAGGSASSLPLLVLEGLRL